MRPLLFVSLLVALVGCGAPQAPRLDTAADSLAFRVTEAMGGLDAWDALPGLAWDWVVIRDSAEVLRNRHVWDKAGDRARSEFRVGGDSTIVAMFVPSTFDPDAPSGQVALNGTMLTGERAAERLVEAHAWFINDSYWLLAPLKVFDPGVLRQVEQSDTSAQQLVLTFEGVGLTPGDRYTFDVDSVSGAVTGWSYLLESGNEGGHDWLDPIVLETPAGPLTLTTFKSSREGASAILTEPDPLPTDVEAVFQDFTPRLSESGS